MDLQTIKKRVQNLVNLIPPVNAYNSAKQLISPEYKQQVNNAYQGATNTVNNVNKWLELDKPVLNKTGNPYKDAGIGLVDPYLKNIRAGFNVLNTPSYALGGILKESKAQLKGEQPTTYLHPAITGSIKGIKNKEALFEQAPSALGVDPNSLGGMAIGLTAEVLTPDLGDARLVGKGKKLIDEVDNLPWMKAEEKLEGKMQYLKDVNKKGVLNETLAQTKFRRSLNIKPEEAYKTALDVKDEFLKTTRVKASNLIQNIENVKDITPTEKGFKNIFRNFEKAFGKEYPTIKRAVLDPFDDAKKTYVEMNGYYSNLLKKNVVDLGISKKSKESAFVQLFGEKKVTYPELLKEFGEVKAQSIVKADSFFRGAYDELLNIVNATRRQLYPNNPEMIIPKRADYYRHFEELSGIEGLKNIFENPVGIDPNLVGVSDFTKPRSKWLSFAQRRTGDDTAYDAVAGFTDYLQKASYASQIDPHILKFRKLESELIEKTEDMSSKRYKELNNMIELLEDFGNDLAGKTNPIDRGIQKYIFGGRNTFRALDWVNKRVKQNVILGNLSSSLTQIFSLPAGLSHTGVKNTLLGAYDATLSNFKKSVIDDSSFIAERYFRPEDFDKSILANTKKFASWITGILDEGATKTIWFANYKKAFREGKKGQDLIRYADEWTRKLVAGRGIGEVPLAQKSKIVGIIAPFQLEVSNVWQLLGKNVENKEFGKIAKFFVWNYLFNSLTEKIMGRRVGLDPINALIEGYKTYTAEPNTQGAVKAGGRVAGEVLSNTMFGGTVAGMYPEYGFKVGDYQAPTREGLFGDQDPTRFGSGLIAQQAITDPLYKLLPPFGGNQLKKTIEGVGAVNQGYSETQTGKYRFPIEKSPRNYLQAGAFGQYAIPEAQQYFKDDRSPLGDKQSEVVKNSNDPLEAYKKIISAREANAQEDKAREAVKSSGQSKIVNDKYIYIDDKGDTASISTNFDVEKPTMTGVSSLNKELTKAYKTKLSNKKSDVRKLYELGVITESEAEKLLESLQQQYNSTSGGGSSKKVFVKAPAQKKLPSLNLKLSNPKTLTDMGKLLEQQATKRPDLKLKKVTKIYDL